jgi:hypothetical protein
MPVLLRDLIDLPERVRQGDFVLRLSEGITKPAETVRDYVVTPQLARCFDEALGLIQSAVQSNSSKGAYLHGSFGSGKSHFMAVLLLLLEGRPEARRIPELAKAAAELSAWNVGKKFLLVPYHMIGAKDITSAVLGGYVDHVLRHHPKAPVPGVYRADGIFANALALRADMGDKTFFTRLNAQSSEGEPSGDDWGDLSDQWDAASFDAVLAAGPKDERRARLVGALVETLLPAMHGTTDYVDIDRGLAIISNHAKQLGYDALILFLDELILWLASHAADVNFISQEGQKLAKLVEAQDANRPIPVVSFIARQRDLRELVGNNMMGVQQVSFSDSLRHWDQRFAVVRLDDRNLSVIAEKRVLRPKSEAAKQQMDQAFRETEKMRKEVMEVLLTSHGTKVDFRAVYPFSPALMETLIALSSLLQRERTALKLMFQILVEQRNTLQLGEIVPVGDLFDVIMSGDEPFSEILKAPAENAKKLYEQKILPLLERDHGLTRDEVAARPPSDSLASAFRRDARLAKTLLLSALTPEVESFKAMTVNKLAALNHGSIRTPVPGREGAIVLECIRKWAAEVGQIRIGDETVNPSVSVQLIGVDTEGILAQAASEDNSGNRIRKIKQLVFERLAISSGDEFVIEHSFEWRATRRICDVLFANVRELNDESLKNDSARWRLIIDYPFDQDSNHTPRSDLATLEKFRQRNPSGARTLVWLPSFLSQTAQKELGKLVVLDHVLTGARFDGYASRLSAVDRAQARQILENQRSVLKVRVGEYLEQAYAVRPTTGGILDTTHQLEPEEHFQSLQGDVAIRTPAAANLQQALGVLLEQAMAGQFPGHPTFDADTRLGRAILVRIWGELQKALGAPDGRTMVDPSIRKEVKAVVTGLKLAQMTDAHLVVDEFWRVHFERKMAQHGAGPISVSKLRAWINDPKPMGLPEELENLILLAYASRANRAWFLFGNPIEGSLESLANEAELREQRLPGEAEWDDAVKRANGIFGLSPSKLRSAANAAKLTVDLKAQTDEFLESVRELVKELRLRLPQMGVTIESADRIRAAQSALSLLEALRIAPERDRITVFTSSKLDCTDVAIGTTIKQARSVTQTLRGTRWVILESVAKFVDARKTAGLALVARARVVLANDEFADELAPSLLRVLDDATRLLAEAPEAPIVPQQTVGQLVPVVAGGVTVPYTTFAPAATGSVAIGVAPSVIAAWQGSDDAEIRAFYAGQPEKLERNRRLVRELKDLYRASQVHGDMLPAAFPSERFTAILEVHHIVPIAKGGPDERWNMLVVSPNLHALIHSDTECAIDLSAGTIVIFGCTLKLQVAPNHRG